HRESFPHREARRIDAEHDQHEQRQMQKNVDRGGVERERARHNRSSSRRRRMTTSSVTTIISTSETAEPKGQSRAVVNWFCTRLPIMTVLPPPSRSGVRNAPTQGMNTRIEPA